MGKRKCYGKDRGIGCFPMKITGRLQEKGSYLDELRPTGKADDFW